MQILRESNISWKVVLNRKCQLIVLITSQDVRMTYQKVLPKLPVGVKVRERLK